MSFYISLLVILVQFLCTKGKCLNNYKVVFSDPYTDGAFVHYTTEIVPYFKGYESMRGWTLQINFTAPLVKDLEMFGDVFGYENSIGKSSVVIRTREEWNQRIDSEGQNFGFIAMFEDSRLQSHLKCIQFCGILDSGKNPCDMEPKISKCNPRYNYTEVLEKSLLFYEAQRSGKLPANNRIKWRRDSALNDGSDHGNDLTGGYYDAGGYVKFGFPMAASITNLAWGMIELKRGYVFAGQYQYGLDALKWGTDYFIKCHTKKEEFWGQVGDKTVDRKYWGRPEEMKMKRPSFKIDENKPGSELAGETAAALAASSIVFKEAGYLEYAAKLLKHAKELFHFANTKRGKYIFSIPKVAGFYDSQYTGFHDELAWACLWLYKATNEIYYKNEFPNLFRMGKGTPSNFDWENKWTGVHVLAATMNIAQTNLLAKLRNIIQTTKRTPKGLIFIQEWGSNRCAANLAFLSLVASKVQDSKFYTDFARQQIHYMLGDSGRSFVVGFGVNPPKRPHHRSSSCPDLPATCDWTEYTLPDPNPQILHGALVGGPDASDNYVDTRRDSRKNEVALDYNAGFQSAIAGLVELTFDGGPSAQPGCTKLYASRL